MKIISEDIDVSIEVVSGTNHFVQYSVSVDGATIYVGNAYASASDSNVVVNLNDILRDYGWSEYKSISSFGDIEENDTNALRSVSLSATDGTATTSWSDDVYFYTLPTTAPMFTGFDTTGEIVHNTLIDRGDLLPRIPRGEHSEALIPITYLNNSFHTDWEYLNFTATNGNATITFTFGTTKPNCEYSFDKSTWTTIDNSGATATISLDNGKTIYLRGNNASGWSKSASDSTTIGCSGAIVKVGGNVMSIIDGQEKGTLTIPNNFCFYRLFYSQYYIVGDVVLPATTLKSNCYNAMFAGTRITSCTILANSLVSACCSYMFYGCPLVDVYVAFDSWVTNATHQWMYGVTTLRRFYKLSALPEGERGQSGVPYGTDIVNYDAYDILLDDEVLEFDTNIFFNPQYKTIQNVLIKYGDTDMDGYNIRITDQYDVQVVAKVDDCSNHRYFLYWYTRNGAVQCQPFTGRDIASERITSTQIVNYKNEKANKVFDISPRWELNSGWLTDEEYSLYRDILTSSVLYLYDADTDRLHKVICSDTAYTQKTFKNEKTLLNLTINVELNKDQRV